MRSFLLFGMLCLSSYAFSAIERAIFAGGCFWCVEADFDKLNGVISTRSGFDGGHIKNPSYALVSAKKTRYLEAVEVQYDSNKLSYASLVKYFMHHIDPTDAGGQFCDRGASYRSAIFYLNQTQKKTAVKVLKELQQQLTPIKTAVRASTTFYMAEQYHQNYYKKNPTRYKYYRWRCGRDKRVKEVWNHDKS